MHVIVEYLNLIILLAVGAADTFIEAANARHLCAVAALYGHLALKVLVAGQDQEKICATVASNDLPLTHAHLPIDIGCLFKRLLQGLPGGILGSMGLFKALRRINSEPFPEHMCWHTDPDSWSKKNKDLGTLRSEPLPAMLCLDCRRDNSYAPEKVKLIALAISAVPSNMRLHLICAVFGLAAHIDQVTLPRFLGPLLLGNATKDIDMTFAHDCGGIFTTVEPQGPLAANKPPLLSLSSFKTLFRGLGSKKKAVDSGEEEEEKKREAARARLCEAVAEMLMVNWEDIVMQMKVIGTFQ